MELGGGGFTLEKRRELEVVDAGIGGLWKSIYAGVRKNDNNEEQK